MNNHFKHSARIVACALAACSLCVLLVSCGGEEAQQKTPAELNRTYMASVNSISAEASDALASFGEAVANDDVAAMRQAAMDASKKLDKITELQAPEALSDVHEEYKAGASDLNTALTDYIEAYATLQSEGESADTEAFSSKISEVQSLYDSGVDHLSKADELVAEFAQGDQAESDENKAE